jgi:hypothetical protein
VGIWLFDEGSGDIARDSSGKGNDATLVNSPAWVDGKFGKALKFNGQDTCVQTGQKLLDGLEEFTIVTWINTDNLTGSRIGLKYSSVAGNDGTLIKKPEWIEGKFGKALFPSWHQSTLVKHYVKEELRDECFSHQIKHSRGLDRH